MSSFGYSGIIAHAVLRVSWKLTSEGAFDGRRRARLTIVIPIRAP